MFKNVEIYSKSNCSFCDKAKYYFDHNDITYQEHNVEIPETFKILWSEIQMLEQCPRSLLTIS